MEPATILSLLLSMVENATSITKKLIIRPMRSAKDTYQPCPPACAPPRFFLAIVDFPDRGQPFTPGPARLHPPNDFTPILPPHFPRPPTYSCIPLLHHTSH